MDRLHFTNWPLRLKMTMVVVMASLLPLGVTAFKDIRESRRQLISTTEALLAARGDQLVGEIDAFNDGYQRSAARFALLPQIVSFCGATGATAAALEGAAREVLAVQPTVDPNVRGAAILDRSAVVAIATEPPLVGLNLSVHPYVQGALQGHAVVSDIHLSGPEVDFAPTLAYVHPVRGANRSVSGFVVLWVRATWLWQQLKASNALAGPGSFAVMFDQDGIRIAHTYDQDMVFHPGGLLDRDVIERSVAERRFGDRTRDLLQEVRAFPEQFDRSRASSPDRGVFRGFAKANETWTYGVARRLKTVSWTLFYMVPEENLLARIAAMTREKVLFGAMIALSALAVGTFFASVVLKPIRALTHATELIAGGNLSARVVIDRKDELGTLGSSFDSMASHIEAQAAALESARSDLERRVHERTVELMKTTESLKVEIAERRRAEDRVTESEEGLRITLDSIGDAVIATDTSGRITRMNPAAERLTGWSFVDAKERTPSEVFHIVDEETRQVPRSPIERVLEDGVVAAPAYPTVLVARDGSERAIADSSAPIRDAEGKVRGVVLVFRDQTEERKAERALRRAEGRFRCFRESGIVGIVISDIAGNITEANDAFLSIVGYSREDLLAGRVSGKTLNTPERDRTDAVARAKLQAEGIAHPWEKELVRKDGRRVPVLSGVVMLEEENGECIAFILDLTERKRAETALRESEARKTAVMEAALDAIVVMDHEGRIIDFNAAAERTFGYSREEVLNEPLAEVLIPSWLRAKHTAGLARYLRTAEEHVVGKRIEVRALKKSGAEFPAEVAIVRIRSEGPPVFTGYIRDITERQRAAEAEILRRAKEAAEAANAELEAFSYSVAHDLRAPLRGISGFSGVLLEDYGDTLNEDAKAQLHRIIAAGERMGQIIDALLSLARLTRTELRRENVDLTQMARAIALQLQADEPERVVEFVAADGIVARGDPELLRAVLENLLGNAWKFTRTQPDVRIEFDRTVVGNDAVYTVRDNGAGFNMAYADKLFAPFQRLHSSGEFEGTGIGLATVQRIVRRHGGRVWAEGVEKQGATFHFTLLDEASTAEESWLPAS